MLAELKKSAIVLMCGVANLFWEKIGKTNDK